MKVAKHPTLNILVREDGAVLQSLQEFAQCGAVILRIMETIEKEI